MKLKDLQAQYDKQANERKSKIKAEPNKWKRFWKWVWYLITFTWVWAWYNLRDWRTFLIFLIVCSVVGISVWLPFIIYYISGNEWWLSITLGSLFFWNVVPCTPYILICVLITIGIKEKR